MPLLQDAEHSIFIGDTNLDRSWPESAAAEQVIGRHCFADAWRAVHGEAPGFTQPMRGQHGKRIDRAFVKEIHQHCIRRISVELQQPLGDGVCDHCNSKGRPCAISDHYGLLLDYGP
jgi:hypothetical protein